MYQDIDFNMIVELMTWPFWIVPLGWSIYLIVGQGADWALPASAEPAPAEPEPKEPAKEPEPSK